MVNRIISASFLEYIDFEKAIVLKGARQVGKTTLIKQLIPEKEALWLDGDDPNVRLRWGNISKENLLLFVSPYKYIVFDEAQRIENIGLTAKMIVDAKLEKQVVLSGSSSLSLASSTNEPLTGRKWNLELFPLSWAEIVAELGLLNALQRLDELLIFGSYPEIFSATNKKEKRLTELTSSYLYKDVLEYGDIRKPELLNKLLRALAFQVGSEVSYNELANLLGVDNQTIRRYIDLLEESYVIFRLEPLSKNPRKEISTSRKVYFYDNGVRNAIINDFNLLNERSDVGALWENFIISEIYKRERYKVDKQKQLFFWRSKNQAEVDLVLEYAQAYEGIEIKYNPNKKVRFPDSFKKTYAPESNQVINRENFFHYLA